MLWLGLHYLADRQAKDTASATTRSSEMRRIIHTSQTGRLRNLSIEYTNKARPDSQRVPPQAQLIGVIVCASDGRQAGDSEKEEEEEVFSFQSNNSNELMINTHTQWVTDGSWVKVGEWGV